MANHRHHHHHADRVEGLDPTVARERLKRSALAAGHELAAMTRTLVRLDSQNPPGDTDAVASTAAGLLEGLPGVEVSFHTAREPIANLVARLPGGRPGRRLILSGHLDTYPVGDAGQWSVDPLGGEVVDERLYGRGAADMKGGIAAMILVMQLFARQVRDFPGELVLALAGDEESMGELGTQHLIHSVPGLLEDAVLVADVGSPAVLRCGEKGMVWLDVTADGRAAHGAHVHRGANAVERLMQALAALKSLEALPVHPPAEVAATMAAAAPLSEPLGGAGEGEVLGRVTVNVGRVEGGTSPNLVPDRALAQLDIRLPVGVSVAQAEAAIAERLRGLSGIGWTVTRRYEATWTSPQHPLVQAGLAAAGEVLARPVTVNMRVGASDARLWRRAGLPTLVCGLTPHNLGGPDEYADLAELPALAAIHALTAWDYLFASPGL